MGESDFLTATKDLMKGLKRGKSYSAVVIGPVDSGPWRGRRSWQEHVAKATHVKQEAEIREIKKGQGKTYPPKDPPPVGYFVQLSSTPEVTH